MIKTNEGANAYEFALDHAVEFFSKSGSRFSNRSGFYENEETALSLYQKIHIVDPHLAIRLAFWCRDCRGGAGNRSGFRDIIRWIAENDSKWLRENIHLIPLYGRWDDLRVLFGTELEADAARFWVDALVKRNVLAAKWADRSDAPLRKFLGWKIGKFRRFLASIRSSHIVEHKMCSNEWQNINYEHVPSVAMARYTKAFQRNDEERFKEYKESLKRGTAKVHADVLFPHDCVRTVNHGDREIADAQFDALPNYMENSNERILVLCDTSGSMGSPVSRGSSVSAIDVSMGLALYCSSRVPKESPFHKRFIGFESESKFNNWEGMSFSDAILNREIFDGAIGATRIDTALKLILKTAKFFNIPQELMPTTLLIVSDMQFHQGSDTDDTEVERELKEFVNAGYEKPKIVYWNLSAYAGQQATANMKNVALVSGYSPSILKAIFGGQDFSPKAIMLRAIEKYEVVVPE